ncbi:hypothetical protein ACFV2X_26600 [Streptomyces sp. NPDC059679]|uniref:hypothetical protein n=1 Tax=Streptomyces sp. NPDC059679 TaxID=3346903 RepID=UPI00369A3CFE
MSKAIWRVPGRREAGSGLRRIGVLLAATLLPVVSTAAPGHAAAAESRGGHAPLAPADLTVGDRARTLDVEGAPLFGWRPRDIDPGAAHVGPDLLYMRVKCASLNTLCRYSVTKTTREYERKVNACQL